MIEPTPEQIENCRLFGWQYLEDGYFQRDQELGWFTKFGFVRD